MRSQLTSFLLCFLLLAPAAPAAAVGLPAGTQIQLVANASFMDTDDQLKHSEPASVMLAVMHVAGVDVAEAGQVGQAIPGHDLYVPITITNTGNGADTFTLSTSSANGWNVEIVYDDSADGIHQEDEQWVIGTAGPMVADGYAPCFAKVSVPQNATISDTVTVTAVSNFDAGSSDQIQISVHLTAPPSVTITSPTEGDTYVSTSPTIELVGTTSGALDIVGVAWSTDRGASGSCVGTSAWTASDVALLTGANVVTVTATDSASRTATATLTVIYNDTTSPEVAITYPVSSDTYTTNGAQIHIAGTASDNIGVQDVTWSNDRGGSGSCRGTTVWSADSITLALGVNVVTISASDAAGNVGTSTLTVTYSPDPLAPTISITSPTSSATYTTSGPSINIAGTASDSVGLQTVSWSSNRGYSGNCSGTTSWSANGITLLIGDNVITVTATNTSGLTSTDTLTVTCEGQQAPVVMITGPTANPTYSTSATSLQVSGTAAHAAGIQSMTWSNLHVGSGSCTGTSEWTASGVLLRAGTNVITVTATSTLGGTASDTITVNCTAPSVTITSPTSASSYSTQRASLDLRGTASGAVASVSWSSNRGFSGTCSGTTSWAANSIPLVLGSNVLTVVASDGGGNGDYSTLTVTRVLDTTDPIITITAPTSESSISRNCPFVTVGGTASDNAAVTGVTYANTTTGETGTCNLTGTNWSALGVILTEGDNQIVVTAADGSGNTASATVNVNYFNGVPGNAWAGLAMVSLPIIPDNADPKLETGFGANMWCTFITADCEYATYPDQRVWLNPPAETPGRGFWARFDSQAVVPYGTIPAQDQPATIHLKAGWNMVGTPFITEVIWDSSALMLQEPGQDAIPMCDAPDLTPGTAWGWRQDPLHPTRGAYYLVADTSVVSGADNRLEPWRAYWIRVYRDCDLIVPSPH